MPVTCIRNAAWIIAWDPATARHAYLRDADLVFEGDRISYVGRLYPGPVDTEIPGHDLMVMPGLVDIHSHPSTEPFFRGIREEHGLPTMFMTGLYERGFAFRPDAEGRQAGKTTAYCEMLLTGITTVADLSGIDQGWIDLAAQSGLRVFVAPSYASASWHLSNNWQLQYAWDEPAGRRGLDAALKLIDAARANPSGRLDGIISPAQIDTCTEDLLRDSHDAAVAKSLPFTTHCSQSVNEFNEMTNRHGITPVQWARDIGILGRHTILGHAIFIDEHSWLHWHTHQDLDILAATQTSIAHCPSPFARYGQTLEDFGRYRRKGVNIGMGTDVAPHNLIEEMRLAATLARVAAEDIGATSLTDVFHAATAGGARALGRTDIGRLEPGAKADLVLVDLKNPWMMPARDPLRSLVYTAADRAIHKVFIDGRLVVQQGKVLTLDHAAALEALTEAQARMIAAVPQYDWARREADQLTPLSLPTVKGLN
ncbi:MAG: 5-methylthioadenosine/S-adenosylhomocysteine deaminase [Acetobacteraceae bacterium]|jgi:5-methylthioadenosine/S-adenosylhomocysteine deaminase|nr:5-methylthioadenosine/S-adenosylhomocysteine deaminase [Acetobacteraceae bacterium]